MNIFFEFVNIFSENSVSQLYATPELKMPQFAPLYLIFSSIFAIWYYKLINFFSPSPSVSNMSDFNSDDTTHQSILAIRELLDTADSPDTQFQSAQSTQESGISTLEHNLQPTPTTPERANRSAVWDYLKSIRANGRSGKIIGAYCPMCATELSTKGSTSSAKKHLFLVHKMLEFAPDAPSPPSSATENPHIFTPGAFEKAIIRLIINKNLPFSLVDSEEFRDSYRILVPSVTIPSSSTLMRRIEAIYQGEQAKLCKLMDEMPGKVSLTTDIWTSRSMDSYLSLTAHWVDASWTARTAILDLSHLPNTHSGDAIYDRFTHLCVKYGIMTKIQAITLDNASANGRFLERFHVQS